MATAKTPSKLIKVKSGNGRAFWERDPQHPGGELFVGNGTYDAYPTSAVNKAIHDGRLVKV